jgi:hypothetical protein
MQTWRSQTKFSLIHRNLFIQRSGVRAVRPAACTEAIFQRKLHFCVPGTVLAVENKFLLGFMCVGFCLMMI